MKVKLRTQAAAPASSSPSLTKKRASISSIKHVDVAAGIPQEDLQAVVAQLEQKIWAADPALFVKERLKEHLWSTQQAIAQSLVSNRGTAVPSCHGSGKSFLAARLAAWWLCTAPPGDAFVVSSAPTGRQVRTILWREIGRVHAKAKLPGRTNQTEWMMEMPAGNEEIVAFGMKPDDMSPTAFQGIHARRVLVVFDEACGIASALWDAADSLISNDDSRFLAIGNPDDPDTEFCKVCKPGSGFNVIHVSAFDTPNFTKEPVPEYLPHLLVGHTWVEEKRRKWGEGNPFWISKVLGQFPDNTVDGLIPMRWIRQAQERDLQPSFPHEMGLDVGGGANKSTYCDRQGPVYRIVRRDQNPDTMATCGELVAFLNKKEYLDASIPITRAKVDEIGIGRGVVNRAHELKYRDRVIGVNVSRPAKDDKHFANIRAEGYWGLREIFQIGNIDIDSEDEDLAAQLVDLKYHRNSRGQIQMESKSQMKISPDDADSLMLASLDYVGTARMSVREAVWG